MYDWECYNQVLPGDRSNSSLPIDSWLSASIYRLPELPFSGARQSLYSEFPASVSHIQRSSLVLPTFEVPHILGSLEPVELQANVLHALIAPESRAQSSRVTGSFPCRRINETNMDVINLASDESCTNQYPDIVQCDSSHEIHLLTLLSDWKSDLILCSLRHAPPDQGPTVEYEALSYP